MLTHFFSFKMIRNNFSHFGISHYCSNTNISRLIDVHTINHFIYSKTKKIALNRLQFKTIFFYISQFSRTEFSNRLVASDLLMI